MKRTKRALLLSILSMFLCVVMLVGTTFAWFSDSVTSGVNKIVAGNLDLKVEYSTDNGATWTNLENSDSLFSSQVWEPGHTEYVTLKVSNNGSLALAYKALVTPVSENGGINVNGEAFKLSDYLVFGTTEPAETCPTYTREGARNAVGTTQGLTVDDLTQAGTLEAGEVCYITLVVYMPETVGNEANYKTGTVAPSIELGISFVATQASSESDSFDNDYDLDAIMEPAYAGVGAYYEYFEAIVQTAVASNGAFEIVKEDANSGILAGAVGEAENGTTVTMTIVKSSVDETSFTAVNTIPEGNELNGYDIKVEGQTENSLVQGKLYVGTGLVDFKFYHNNVEMTVGTKGALVDGEYFYDTTDGFVYFATKSFSPFQATYKAPEVAIGSAVYGTIYDAIAAAPTNATTTITLLKDVENGASFGFADSMLNSGRNIYLNLNGHTYEILAPGMGSTGTQTQGLHLASGNSLTIVNGTLSVAPETTAIKRMIQNYCDLTLVNVTVDCTNLVYKGSYDNSFCQGTVTLKGNTNFIATTSDAKIFDVDGSYSTGNVAVIFDENYTGTVEGIIEYTPSKTTRTSTLTINAGTFTDFDPTLYVPSNKGVLTIDGKYVVTGETWANNVATAFSTIDTEKKTITIMNEAELALFANNATTYNDYTVTLGANMNLGSAIWNTIPAWRGTFDGNGYSINNMTIKDMTSAYVGLFSTFDGTIKNVTFNNANVTGNRAAVVVGFTKGAKVELDNVKVLNSVVTGVQKNAALIGFASGAQNGGCQNVTVQNCTVDGLVFTDDLGDDSAWQCGAIIGYTASLQNITVLNNIVNNVSMEFDPAVDYPNVEQYASHPLIGSIYTGDVRYNCSAYTVTIKGNTVTNCTGFAKSNTWEEYCGGHQDFASIYSATVIIDDVVVAGNWASHGASSIATIDTTAKTMTINSLGELIYFANHSADYANYTVTLGVDIDLDGYFWAPINLAEYTVFDGNNHTISNMTVVGEKQVGFFGACARGCTIKNLTIDNANVSGINHVAGVTGYAICCNIENCHVTNSVITSSVKDNDDGDKAGAIVGYFTCEPNGHVSDCSATNCTVTGYRDIGGLIGYVGCYNTSTSAYVSDNTVTDCTVICDNTVDYKNYATAQDNTLATGFDVNVVIGDTTDNANVATVMTIENNTAVNSTADFIQ